MKAECSSSDYAPNEQNFHPPAFYVLLNHIVNHGFMERQLFQINGDPDEVRAIIDTIDGEQVVGNVSDQSDLDNLSTKKNSLRDRFFNSKSRQATRQVLNRE